MSSQTAVKSHVRQESGSTCVPSLPASQNTSRNSVVSCDAEDIGGRGSSPLKTRKEELDLKERRTIIREEGRTDTGLRKDGKQSRGAKYLDQYEAGELESQFMQKVMEGDVEWLQETCVQAGRELVMSDYGEGWVKTAILYAAKNADVPTCKLLVRWGGKELLNVKDVKGRDAAYFAKEQGWDISSLTAEAGVDCWNVNQLQRGIQNMKNRAKDLGHGSTEGSRTRDKRRRAVA